MNKQIKKWVWSLSALALLGLAFGGSVEASAKASKGRVEDKKTITVGVNPLRDQIFEAVRPYFKKAGYQLDIKVVADPAQLNEATNDGRIDINFQQHEIYLKQFNKNRQGDLVVVGDKLYNQAVGLFSKKYHDLKDIPNGGVITLQNDPTNRDRGLKVLVDAGLVSVPKDKLKGDAPLTLLDITDNPKNLKFVEVSGENLVKSLQDTDGAVLNGFNIAKAGLKAKDALALYKRKDNEKYAIILATKKGNEKQKWVKVVEDSLKTKEAVKTVDKISNGAVTPLFEGKK